jgi:hypothetical protein
LSALISVVVGFGAADSTREMRYAMQDPSPGSGVVSKDRVVLRFAGDSGDGMQLTGDRFTVDEPAISIVRNATTVNCSGSSTRRH